MQIEEPFQQIHPFGTPLDFGVVLIWLLGRKPSRHQAVVLVCSFPSKSCARPYERGEKNAQKV